MLSAPATAIRFKRLLLTGAAGNLGKVLRPRLKAYCDVLRVSHRRDFGPAGAGEEVVLAELSDRAQVLKLLEGVMRPQTLTPIAVFEELVDTCEKLFGNNLIELPRAIGRTIASRELPASLRSAMAGATVSTVVARLPLAWTALYDVGFISVAPADSACVLEVRGASIRSQSHALLLTGLVARLVESSGAKDVRAYIVHTRAPSAAVAMHVRFR